MRCALEQDVGALQHRLVDHVAVDLHPFSVSGRPEADGTTVRLWAQDHEGWLTMDAVATLRGAAA